jgi:hypothetical protein
MSRSSIRLNPFIHFLSLKLGAAAVLHFKKGDFKNMKIDQKDIAALKIKGDLICIECFSEEDETVTLDMILSFDELEKMVNDYFCDRCKKKLER